MLPSHATTVERIAHYGTYGAAWLVLIFLILPILIILPLSFTAGSLLVYPIPGFSTRWYAEFFGDRLWVDSVRNSFTIASATTVIATLLGTTAALGLSRMRSRWSSAIMGLMVMPIVVPVIVYAVAVFYVFAGLGLAGTFTGLIAAHSVLATPFVVVTVTATLQGFDSNLVRAGASLGAPPLRVFLDITLPSIFPGVISGAIFAFVTSFDELIVTIFLASPEQRTLPRQIWAGVIENISPTITVAAMILMLVSLLLMSVVELLRRRTLRLRGMA